MSQKNDWNVKLKHKAPTIINNLINVIAVSGANLRRVQSSKHKIWYPLKWCISVIIEQISAIFFAVHRVDYSLLKKKETCITDYQGVYSKGQ